MHLLDMSQKSIDYKSHKITKRAHHTQYHVQEWPPLAGCRTHERTSAGAPHERMQALARAQTYMLTHCKHRDSHGPTFSRTAPSMCKSCAPLTGATNQPASRMANEGPCSWPGTGRPKSSRPDVGKDYSMLHADFM